MFGGGGVDSSGMSKGNGADSLGFAAGAGTEVGAEAEGTTEDNALFLKDEPVNFIIT